MLQPNLNRRFCFVLLAVTNAAFPVLLNAGSPSTTTETRDPLPGLLSNPALLPGNRRWQMFAKAPSAATRAVAYGPDGKWLAMSAGRSVRIYLAADSYELKKLLVGHTDLVRAIRFSPDGERIATASIDGTVRIWDLDASERFVFREHEDAVHDVAWHPDGQRLASASADGTVKIWAIDGKTIASRTDHEAPVNAVAWNPNGKILVSGCENKVIRFWSSEGEEGPVATGHIGPIRALAWNPDGTQLLSCDHGIEAAKKKENDLAHLKIWNVKGEQINSIAVDLPLSHACWSPDGQRALAGGSMWFRIWTPTERTAPVRRFIGLLGLNIPVAWKPVGEQIIAANQVFDVNANPGQVVPVRRLPLTSVAVSPDGKTLAVGSPANGFLLYDTDGRQVSSGFSRSAKSNPFAGSPWINVYWKPDGTSFIPVSRSAQSLQQYDAQGKEAGEPVPLMSNFRDGSWSADGKFFAIGGDGREVTLVSMENSNPTQLGRQAHGITRVRFTPDQKQVCSTGYDGCVRFWSRDGKPGKVLEAISTSIRGLSLASDGQLLATGSEDGTIRFWNDAGETVNVAGGHGGYIESVDFNADGSLLASASWDQSARIWKRDGTPVSVLRGHEGSVLGVHLAPDGHHLYSCADDGAVRKWNVVSGESEWQSFLGESSGYVTIDSTGRMKHGDEKVLESDFLFFAEDEHGQLVRSDWPTIRDALATSVAK